MLTLMLDESPVFTVIVVFVAMIVFGLILGEVVNRLICGKE